MPELPDVEIFKRYVDATSLHKRIESVSVSDERILRETTEKKLKSGLEGKAFDSAVRHGKYLFVSLDGGVNLLMHFGMTGFVRYYKTTPGDLHHTRVLFDFDNGYHLAYSNQRLLGKIGIVGSVDDFIDKNNLGPDAGEIDFTVFSSVLAKGRGTVKGTLMNQNNLAGIGNIYSDEILYQAGIHPEHKENELEKHQIKKLYEAMRTVLKTAVDCGANPDEMPDSYLLPHRADGAECPGCKGTIEKTKISGRSTYYCPKCQK